MHRALGRVSGFTGTHIAVLAFVLLLLISIPIWTVAVPPLSDYPNHLARMHIIANVASNTALAQFYEVKWQVIPNLMMDLVVPWLGRMMNIYLAGQVFTIMTFAMIVSGALALNRVLVGRWTTTPLFIVPFLYNYVFLIGVMNYIFGIGLALWGLAAFLALGKHALPVRLAVSACFVVALFFCHLFAVGIYGIGVLAFEAMEAWRRRRTEPLLPIAARMIAGGLPFLAVIPLLLVSPTLQLAHEIDWEPKGKIDGLVYAIEIYSDIVAILIVSMIAAAAIWSRRHGLLRVHPLGWFVLGVAGVVYLAMPRILFASYMADQRLPIAIVFMFSACVDVNLRPSIVRRGFIALLLTLVAVRLIEVNVSWSNLSVTTAQFRASVKRIKPGSKVLVAYGARNGGDDVADLGLVHAACLAIIERSALVSTAFTVTGKQILHVRPAYHDQVDTLDGTPPSIEEVVLAAGQWSVPEGAYWRDWTTRFDYLYVLFTDLDDPNPEPKHLTLVQAGERFQLYRIAQPRN